MAVVLSVSTACVPDPEIAVSAVNGEFTPKANGTQTHFTRDARYRQPESAVRAKLDESGISVQNTGGSRLDTEATT
mgnify:FL=1